MTLNEFTAIVVGPERFLPAGGRRAPRPTRIDDDDDGRCHHHIRGDGALNERRRARHGAENNRNGRGPGGKSGAFK